MSSKKELITRLVLDFNLMHEFGPRGNAENPIDVSPFSFMVLSDYSQAYHRCKDIIELKDSTTLMWSLEGLSNVKTNITISEITLKFNIIGPPDIITNNKIETWASVFDNDDKSLSIETHISEPLSVKVVIPGKLTLPGTIALSNVTDPIALITKDKIGVRNDFSYSLAFTFLMKDKTYYFRLDPLIKNNSNGPTGPCEGS